MSNSSSFPLLPVHSNSKFETYRLSSSSSSTTTTTSYALPGSAVTQGRVHGKTLLSAKEVESRIKHDHLGVGAGGWFCWVDEEWGIWAVKIGEVSKLARMYSAARAWIERPEGGEVVQNVEAHHLSLPSLFFFSQDFTPHFSTLGCLPVPLPSPNSPPAEYPSVWSFSPTTYLLSDGHGRIYPLRVRPSSTQIEPILLGPAYELNSSGEELRPFKVEWVGGEREVLISSVRRERLKDGASWGKEKGWEVMLVRFGEDWDQESEEGMEVDSEAKKLEVLWTLKGEDVPLYAHFSSGRFLLGSSSHYSLPNPPISTSSTSSTPPPPPTPLAQAPFTWTQTSTSLTVVFSSVPTKPSSLALQSKTLAIPALLGFEPTDNRTYWDAVKPSESTWTYESGSKALTLELEKQNAQTRWPSLFTPSPSLSQPSFEDIPETLTIEQSSAIAQNLARFTSSFQDDDDASAAPSSFPPGLEPGGMSSLMRQEMDLDEDEEEGEEMASTKKEVKWTFVGKEEGGEVEKVRGQETILGREMGWGRSGFGSGEGRFPEVLVKGSVSFSFFCLCFGRERRKREKKERRN